MQMQYKYNKFNSELITGQFVDGFYVLNLKKHSDLDHKNVAAE